MGRGREPWRGVPWRVLLWRGELLRVAMCAGRSACALSCTHDTDRHTDAMHTRKHTKHTLQITHTTLALSIHATRAWMRSHSRSYRHTCTHVHTHTHTHTHALTCTHSPVIGASLSPG